MNKPRPYDFNSQGEAQRLMNELRGYVSTCERDHHGTDREGRQHALRALQEICTGPWTVLIIPSTGSTP